MEAILLIMCLSGATDLRPLLDAIRYVESCGDDRAVGDQGRSRGPYQLQRSYWRDAGMTLDYNRWVWDRAASERAMVAYWHRYCPKALTTGDRATLARVHNGGPAGARKEATRAYWAKVKGELQASREAAKARPGEGPTSRVGVPRLRVAGRKKRAAGPVPQVRVRRVRRDTNKDSARNPLVYKGL